MKKNYFKIVSLLLVVAVIVTSSVNTSAANKKKSKSVSLNVKEVSIAVGDIICLNARMKPIDSTDNLTWKSSNKKIASVTRNGVVTACNEGKAVITVKTSSGKKANCTIHVKKTLTEEDVLNVIKSNVLTEEKVEELIKNNTVSEEVVKQLINDNVLTKDQILTLIKDNTLSEDQVKQIIEQSAVSYNHNWENGTLLTNVGDTSLSVSGADMTIDSIVISKEHYTEKRGNCPQLYRYKIHVEGTTDLDRDYIEKKFHLSIQYYSEAGNVADSRYYGFGGGNVESNFNVTDNKYTIDFYQYNIYVDLDSYFISEAEIMDY